MYVSLVQSFESGDMILLWPFDEKKTLKTFMVHPSRGFKPQKKAEAQKAPEASPGRNVRPSVGLVVRTQVVHFVVHTRGVHFVVRTGGVHFVVRTLGMNFVVRSRGEHIVLRRWGVLFFKFAVLILYL